MRCVPHADSDRLPTVAPEHTRPKGLLETRPVGRMMRRSGPGWHIIRAACRAYRPRIEVAIRK